MNFVPDNSVTTRCYFGDGPTAILAYATHVLDAMCDTAREKAA